VRGSSRLRRLERDARRRREALENADTIAAHDWLWQNERWDLFDPMIEPAEDYLTGLENGDEELMRQAEERFRATEAELMKAYHKTTQDKAQRADERDLGATLDP